MNYTVVKMEQVFKYKKKIETLGKPHDTPYPLKKKKKERSFIRFFLFLIYYVLLFLQNYLNHLK